MVRWFPEQIGRIVDAQISALARPSTTREDFLQRLATRAPTAAVAIGANLRISTYERLLTDILDAAGNRSPQAAARRFLAALVDRNLNVILRMVHPDLALRLTGSRDAGPETLHRALRGILNDALSEEGWGFATAKRVTSPETELVN